MLALWTLLHGGEYILLLSRLITLADTIIGGKTWVHTGSKLDMRATFTQPEYSIERRNF